jgi:hypothetical protein
MLRAQQVTVEAMLFVFLHLSKILVEEKLTACALVLSAGPG